MSSMLAAVRGAMSAPDDDDLPEAGATGANAPQTQESGMSAPQTPAGVPQADHEAAVSAARAEGRNEANTRLQAALGAEGVRGDAARMSAALDLAMESPEMSGAAIAAFVTKNVAASAGAEATPEAHDKRVLGAGQALPGADKPNAGASVNWADFRAKRGKK